MWDCIPLLNEPVINFIKSKGGLKAIAFSHPHFYSTMNDWAAVFDCPVYIHKNDEQWIMNKSNHINLWSGSEKRLFDNIKLINTGGHFAGSSLLHIPALSTSGIILCGDTLYISRSKKHIAIMYSYPNQIPLPLKEVNRIKNQLALIEFDILFGAFGFQNILADGKDILSRSMERYL